MLDIVHIQEEEEQENKKTNNNNGDEEGEENVDDDDRYMAYSQDLMEMSRISYKTNKVKDSVFKENLKPYNLCISFLTFVK